MARKLTISKVSRFWAVFAVAFGRAIAEDVTDSVARARELAARYEALPRPMWWS